MRLLTELAGRTLGQKVVIENRSGAGGTLVMPVLQQAAPDGYTIAQMPQPVFRAPWLQKVAWDPIRDTTPIIQISGVTFGIVVPAASPLRSLDDMFALARARPGELTVATNGVGTTPHLVMDELSSRRGLYVRACAVQGHVRADDRSLIGPGHGRRQFNRIRAFRRQRASCACWSRSARSARDAGRRCPR